MAQKGHRAACPLCLDPVLAKCGNIKVNHWAHLSCDCDTFKQSETEWHIKWKQLFPTNQQECVMKKNGITHRADVKTNTKIIEFQKSSISVDQITDRERFYGNMVWVVDVSDFCENFRFSRRSGFESFRWLWPRITWTHAVAPIFLDFGDSLFQIKKVYRNIPCGGWGLFWHKDLFLDWAKN